MSASQIKLPDPSSVPDALSDADLSECLPRGSGYIPVDEKALEDYGDFWQYYEVDLGE